jgi:alpha-beta hydrolase superfamily lysophospholipase
MIARFFYIITSLLFLAGIFIVLSPALLTPDIIYPVRTDSAYIAYHASLADNEDTLMFSPAYIGLKYDEMNVVANDGILLNGWFVSAADTPANTILIVHDLNESKYVYIDQLKQFHDRGFNAAVFDLRAHGTSGGNEFSPGIPAIEDIKLISDSILKKKGVRNLVYMGCGLGSAIALQSAVYDDRCAGLVLQSPFKNYQNYLQKYALEKWGVMKNLWYPVLKRRSESLMHYPVKELDLSEIAAYTNVPTLFILGSNDEITPTSETMNVFDASATEKKELILVKQAMHGNIAKIGGESYYNRITAFLISNLPKEQSITRYKKLAVNDQ